MAPRPPYPEVIAKAVQGGAGLLDRKKAGWWRGVDLEILQMRYANNCLLGQIFGDYWRGLAILRLAHVTGNSVDGDARGHVVELGFYARTDKDWASLERAWHDVISLRQAGARTNERTKR